MAHFAQIDENNIVTQVIVVGNEDCLDSDGNESEAVGIAFLQSVHGGGTYVQTSVKTKKGKHFTSNTYETKLSETQEKAFRGNYGEVGSFYDSATETFRPPKPFSGDNIECTSWVWNQSKNDWEAPIACPDENDHWLWFEADQKWKYVTEENVILDEKPSV